MSENVIFPGDKIAIIEEYESGQNTFDDGHAVRSSVVGIPELDKKNRTAEVKNSKMITVPKPNDIVIGTVSAVMSSMIAVTMQYINGRPTNGSVECICQTRNLRKKNVALMKDVMMLKIISNNNGTFHATISEPELGVLFTKCKKCAGKTIPYRDAIKCVDCSWIDERKLSKNFEKNDFIKLGV